MKTIRLVFFIISFILALFWSAAVFSYVRLDSIQVANSQTMARMSFSLNKPTGYHVFTLENPKRLVIDFEDTKLISSLALLRVNGISSVRSGHPKPNDLRLVFDLQKDITYKQFFSSAENQLNLELYFAAPTQTPVSISKVNKKTTLVVVIDPGHGGKDTGAIGQRGTREKNVVLQISKKLADLINRQKGMRAVLTRDGDYFIPLRDRLKLARKGKADLFVAVHADAYFNNGANGASVYALSRRGATSEAARWLAKRENYSELGGVDLGELGDQSYMLRSVLIDLAQTATITDSLRLGTSILNSLDNIARLHHRRVEQAPFVVLKSPDIPSVLVETGFISNPVEEIRLSDPRYQSKLAQAMFNGLQYYLQKYSPGM